MAAPKKKKQEGFDDSFYKFAVEITAAIKNNEDGTDQKQQVDNLLETEIKFKEFILKYRQSTEIYKKFVQKICRSGGKVNIVALRFALYVLSFSHGLTATTYWCF